MAYAAPDVMGTVTKVDAPAEKLTIQHEAIPNLGMEGMTMVFKAADKGMLQGVRAGDKVDFQADRVNGQLTVTTIRKRR